MKLVHINLNEGILVDAINCTEWVIESPEYFSEYVMEFFRGWLLSTHPS